MNTTRLLNAARAVREHPAPYLFTMWAFQHECGTPACVLGCYAARPDLQDEFYLTPNGYPRSVNRDVIWWEDIGEHFGITEDQYNELFRATGCDCAKTPIQAAEYIEDFVFRHTGVRRSEAISDFTYDDLVESMETTTEQVNA